MMPTLPRGVRRPLARALVAALFLAPASGAQLPGPIQRIDDHTVALGKFDTSIALFGQDGPNLVKSTGIRHPSGMFDSAALLVPVNGGVSIHRADNFNVAEGTIEMWVRRGVQTPVRQTLFSLQGLNTLDGGKDKALIVGEASQLGPAMSRVIYNTEDGLDVAGAARFRSRVPRGISIGDVDGDGARDMAVSMHAGGGVHIYRGPIVAGVTYSLPDIFVPVPEPQGNTLADLDGDGDLDLLVCSYEESSAPIFGFENQGDGSFAELDLNFFGFGEFAEGMAVGDVNRDGVLDVLFANLDTTHPGAVLLGFLTPEGRWTIDIDQNELFSALSFVVLGACLADVDRDGWLDAVLTRPLNDEVVVHLNDGEGGFRELPEMILPVTAPFTVAADKDIDNDGYLDIAVASWRTVEGEDTFRSQVLFGPDFQESRNFPVENAVSLTLGDVDGDGWKDLFLRSSTAQTSRLYYLDVNGEVRGAQVLPTTPTDVGSEHGPGIGVYTAISGGTTPYSSVLDDSNSFELFLEEGGVHFRITDKYGRAHQVSAPFSLGGGQSVNGYRHVSAEWALHSGLLQLKTQPPTGSTVFTYQAGAPIEVGLITPHFRLGTDFENQRACRGCRLDDVRISDVRRSQVDVTFQPSN